MSVTFHLVNLEKIHFPFNSGQFNSLAEFTTQKSNITKRKEVFDEQLYVSTYIRN